MEGEAHSEVLARDVSCYHAEVRDPCRILSVRLLKPLTSLGLTSSTPHGGPGTPSQKPIPNQTLSQTLQTPSQTPDGPT